MRFFFLFVLIIYLVFNPSFCVFAEEADERDILSNGTPFSVVINTIEYTGVYEGEKKGTLPEGEGTFIVDDSYGEKKFTYVGEFVDGEFEGKGKLFLENGVVIQGRFQGGLLNGRVEITYPDGTFKKTQYSKGIPYGVETTYSSASEEESYDFYYDGETIRSLKENAEEIDYRGLFQEPQKYYGSILKVEGTVKEIYETSTECIIKLVDTEENAYWCTYQNTRHKKYAQAIMPSLELDEEIELYAFFIDLSAYSTPNVSTTILETYPKLVPITCITEDYINRLQVSYKYSEVIRFPYIYYRLQNTFTGVVENVFFDENKERIYIRFIDDDNNIYYVSTNYPVKEDMPIPGDSIKFKGRYYGLYKDYEGTQDDQNEEDMTLNSNNSASFYVYLEASKIKVVN